MQGTTWRRVDQPGLVLLHALVANSTKHIVDVLDEQSAGLIATQAEKAGAGA